ncbi:MAG: PspC domain-containing protein [Bacteroidetes bacterium]|nr:PspC domain-containing protein [Bacteroidota bacterium]
MKMVDISLNGVAFVLDEEAYFRLNIYIQSLKTAYGSQKNGKEIIDDIEARIAELFLNGQKENLSLITLEKVEEIISQLGEPEDSSENVEHKKIRFERRFYRDEKNSKIGGVLSGLSNYFGISLILLRLLFIASMFIEFFISDQFWISICLYLILWAIVPKAKTARQKMEMHGEPITASTIEKSIKKEIKGTVGDAKSSKIAKLFVNLFYVIGKILKFFLMFIFGCISFVFILLLFAFVISSIVVMVAYIPFVEVFVSSNPYIAVLLSLLILIIPLILIYYLLIKTVFSVKWRRGITISLVLLWILSLGSFVGIAVNEGFDRIERFYETEEINVTSKSGVLNVISSENKKSNFDFREGVFSKGVYYRIKTDSTLDPSNFRIVVNKSSFGRNSKDAQKNLELFKDFEIKIETDSSVEVPPYLLFNGEKVKFRGQNIKIDIYKSEDSEVKTDSYLNRCE